MILAARSRVFKQMFLDGQKNIWTNPMTPKIASKCLMKPMKKTNEFHHTTNSQFAPENVGTLPPKKKGSSSKHQFSEALALAVRIREGPVL